MSEFFIRLNGRLKQVKILDDQFIEVDDVRLSYSITESNHSKFILKINNNFYEAYSLKNSEGEDSIQINNVTIDLSIRSALQEKAYQLLSTSQSNSEQATIVKSPMPGLVLKILKKVGDSVNKGDTVMILEAMKMENEIKSNKQGKITEVFVTGG